nr:MAG: protein B [Sichuan sediment noda-like virus 9]
MNAKNNFLDAIMGLPENLRAQQALFKLKLAQIHGVPTNVAADLAGYQSMLGAIASKAQKATDSLMSKPTVREFLLPPAGKPSAQQIEDLSLILKGIGQMFQELRPALTNAMGLAGDAIAEEEETTGQDPEPIHVDVKLESMGDFESV